MSIVPINITSPLTYDLILTELERIGVHPLISGDTVSFRFQLRDDTDVAASLSAASITMTITYGATTVTRTTGVLISGSTYQVAIDAGQGSEVGYTGKGWYQINFGAAETVLAALVGKRCDYKIKITLGDGTVITHLKGKIDVA